MCVTGEQAACPCLGGGQGVQVCLADGTFDVCMCPEMGAGADDLSAPADDLSVPAADLAGADLVGLPPDFAGADLYGVDLSQPPPDLAGRDFSIARDLAQNPPDFAGVDLFGVDLTSAPDFGGTNCGAAVCSGGQLCCLSSPSSGMCESSGNGACDGGSPFVCDGPEDCPGGQCCVVVDTNGKGGETGQSYCATSCPSGSYSANAGGGAHEVSIMCHGDGDCVGYSGTIPIIGGVSFDGCCHSAATGAYHVCIPTMYAAIEGYTCP
jgi:hypothetical protein